MKKGAGQERVRSESTRPLWDYYIGFQAYVRSYTAQNLYVLQLEVTETVMSGKNLFICQFCEFGFYHWVTFRDEPIQCPDENPVLGRYLEYAIDVSLNMTANFIKDNGEVVHS